MTVNDERTETTRIFLNAYLQAEIIKGLKYKLNVGIRKEHTKYRKYTDAYDLGTFGKNDKPDLEEKSSTWESWVLENTMYGLIRSPAMIYSLGSLASSHTLLPSCREPAVS